MIFPAVPIIKKGDKVGLNVSGRYQELWNETLKKLDKYGYAKVTIEKPDSPATEKQNKTFHALIGELYISGLHSFSSYESLKIFCKTCALTQCYKEIEINGKSILDVKSWSKFTKKERASAIDFTINECIQVGLNTKKFNEIIEGLNN
jgi:hypothetical protein